MKLLRAITRRGFSVGTVGWFTVLKPNTWFPASRLPNNLRHRSNSSAETNYAGDHGRMIPPRMTIPSTKGRSPLYLAIVVFAAISITSAMLWWIMHP